MKSKAFLFGLNYAGSAAPLSGCINDVANMSQYLQQEWGMPCEVFTDAAGDPTATSTTAMGMLTKLYEIALQTHRDQLDFVWLHYTHVARE